MTTEITIKDEHSEVFARIEPGESTEEIVEYFYYLMLAKGHHAVKNYVKIEDD